MFLAFKLSDLITVPFGWVLARLYDLTGNYGAAMVVFAIVVYMIMLPITAKGKKSTMKMSRLSPMIQDIQRRYPNDQQKQNEMMQKLYADEGVNMSSGCLWSLVPMLILIPLYGVVRQPIIYLLGESAEVAELIVETLQSLSPDSFGSNSYYYQVTAAQLIPQFTEELKAAIPAISDAALAGVNFNFLGINVGSIPDINIFKWAAYDWAHIGLLLFPCLSAASSALSSFIMQKMNNSVVTDKNGVRDKETAENSQTAQTNKMMTWMMPLMMLWFGFSVPASLSLYWFVGGVVRTIQDVFLTMHYRKIYDAEDAIRLQKRMEQEAIEAERERIRAERRAANPEGQTQNTSKKKLQKAEREREAAARAAAKREYNAKHGIVEEEEENLPLSGIADRPFCKGRAYDPDRYNRKVEE